VSAIVVVLDLRGQRLDAAEFERSFRAIADRGPDGRSSWVRGPIGLGQQLLAATPEEIGSTQLATTDQLVGVFDGRIDNREDLIDQLRSPDEQSPTDAELALLGFAEWGRACAERLLGDFGFAVWDARSRRLFCARDQMGERPLYYFQNGRRLILSTDIRAVLASSAVVQEPNEQHVAEILLEDPSNDTDTLYKGVLRLPPAHFIEVRESRVTQRRYWDLDLTRELSSSDSHEYLAMFETIVEQAVRSRLRAVRPTVALSGGLDSSLVAATAARTTSSVTTTSVVYPGLDCDESAWIDAVTGHLGLCSRKIPWTPSSWEELVEESRRSRYLPPYPNTTIDVFARAAVPTTSVITGIGGDEWLTGRTEYFGDLWEHRNLGQLADCILRGGGAQFARAAATSVASRAKRRLFGTSSASPGAPDPEWLGPSLRGLAAPPRPPDRETLARARTRTHRARYWTLGNHWNVMCFDFRDRAAVAGNFVSTDSYHDRRLVEFACALPDSERWRGSDDRWLIRRALHGVVPHEVAARRTKVGFNVAAVEQVKRIGLEHRLSTSRVVDLGWVQPGLQEEGLLSLVPSPTRMWIRPAWSIAAVEAWLRAVWG
jgi:asparagine synthase (glutamine-hydrolysing)